MLQQTVQKVEGLASSVTVDDLFDTTPAEEIGLDRRTAAGFNCRQYDRSAGFADSLVSGPFVFV